MFSRRRGLVPPPERDEQGAAALEAFQAYVLANPEVQARLMGLPNQQEFAAQVIAVGAERGYHFTLQDVNYAIAENRRVFLTSQKRILPWMYLP